MNILIAEDDTILALFIKTFLIDLGFPDDSIEIVDTGTNAIKQTRKLKPDLIFMDINMEFELDGVSASLEINHIDPEIKIVFASAYPRNSMLDDIKDVVIVDYLEKPLCANSIKFCLDKLGLIG